MSALKPAYPRMARVVPLVLLLSLLLLFFYFRMDRFLQFSTLQQYRFTLISWTHEHYFLTVMIYIITYILAVAISIPGATFFTLIGGFLFGIWLGTFYVLISATLGAIILFLAVRFLAADWMRKSSNQFLTKMKTGFKEDAFNYLLFLRIIPLFPFWAVNVVAALLNVSLSTFAITTLIGIIPGTLIYTALGSGLGKIFDENKSPNIGIIFEPYILLPLIGLAIIALLPVLFKYFKGKKTL